VMDLKAPAEEPHQDNNTSTTPNGHEASLPPLSTGEQQLLQFNYMQHTPGLNEMQEGSMTVISNILYTEIGEQQLPLQPYIPGSDSGFADNIGRVYSSPLSDNIE